MPNESETNADFDVIEYINDNLDALEGVELSDAWAAADWTWRELIEYAATDEGVANYIVENIETVVSDVDDLVDQIRGVVIGGIDEANDDDGGGWGFGWSDITDGIDDIIDGAGRVIEDIEDTVSKPFEIAMDGIDDLLGLLPDLGDIAGALVQAMDVILEPALEYFASLLWDIISVFLDPARDQLIEAGVEMFEISQEVAKRIAERVEIT